MIQWMLYEYVNPSNMTNVTFSITSMLMDLIYL